MMMLAQAINEAAPTEIRLTVAGGLVMFLSIILVTGLNAFCMYRILRGGERSSTDDRLRVD